jgi:hypothetical protein
MKAQLRTNTVARNALPVSGLLVGRLIGGYFGSTVIVVEDDVLTRQR